MIIVIIDFPISLPNQPNREATEENGLPSKCINNIILRQWVALREVIICWVSESVFPL